MADYPWAVLELEPTSDVRLIRKAYATLLRAKRPEEDADEFQRLVRARDFALRLAPQIELLPSFPEDTEAESPEPDDDALDKADLDAFFGDMEAGPDVNLPDPSADMPVTASVDPSADAVPVSPPAADNPGTRLETAHPDPVAPRESQKTDPEAGMRLAGEPKVLPEVTPSDIAYMLQALDQPSMFASSRTRWKQIFDRAEFAPLENHDFIMALIVRRLVEHLQYKVPDVRNDGLFGRKPPQKQDDVLMGYGEVLRDFERHFRVLDEDKVLRRYLSDDDALYLIEALTIACGRDHPRSGVAEPVVSRSRLHAMPMIDRDFLEAAYRQDSVILAYYDKCRVNGRYETSFSWFPLVFPLAWAMCHRLTGLAWLFGVLLAMCTGIAVIHHFGRATEIDELVPAVLVSISIACALQSHRLRLQELARTVVHVQSKGGTHQTHVEKVHRLMHRSRILGGIGFLITGLCLYGAVLYGLILETTPL